MSVQSNTYRYEDAQECVEVPALVGCKTLCGVDNVGRTLRLELWVCALQEQQQLLHHGADIVGVDQRKAQLQRAPPYAHIGVLHSQHKFMHFATLSYC